MKNVNTYTNDGMIGIYGRVHKETYNSAKRRAFDDHITLAQLLDKAIRKYVGLDDLPKEGAAK